MGGLPVHEETQSIGSMAETADPLARIDRSIWRAYILLDALDRRTLAGVQPPLTPAQYHALTALARVPMQSLGELAERLLCAKANASGIVDRLLALGLVDRARDPHDARRVCLSLTEGGRAALHVAIHARTTALLHALAPAELSRIQSIAHALDDVAGLLDAAVRGTTEIREESIHD